MTNSTVESFLTKFLVPPKGVSPEAIAERIRHWIAVANSPELFVKDDSNSYEIRNKRRTARQNLRRLIKKHGKVAEQIMQEAEAK